MICSEDQKKHCGKLKKIYAKIDKAEAQHL
jgi:hypothetical protein